MGIYSGVNVLDHVPESVIGELSEYFKLSQEEVFRRLQDSWEIYLNEFKAFNRYSQSDFARWYQRTNEWYDELIVHVFEQYWFRYFHTPKIERAEYVNYCVGDVLDFGCGVASFSLEALAENLCDDLYLLDSSANMRKFLKYTVEKRGLQDRTFIINKPPPVMKFDRIFVLDVLEHIPDPIGWCRYLKSFLKDDGLFIVSAPFWDFISPVHLGMHKDLTVPQVFEAVGVPTSQYVDMTKQKPQ